MKICLITHSFNQTESGSDVSARKIVEALKKNGNEVFVITSYNPDIKKSFFDCLKFLKPKIVEMEGIKVYVFYPFLSNIPFKGVNIGKFFTALNFWNLWTYICVKEILKKEKPDVVHTNTFLYLSPSFFTAIKSLGIPIVHTVRDFMLLSLSGTFLNPFTNKKNEGKSVLNFLDKLYQKIYFFINLKIIDHIPDIVTSPSIKWVEPHLKYGFFKDCKKIEFPNLFEIKKFKSAFKNRMHNKRTFDILFVGALTSDKGPDILIKAFKKLQNKNICLHIVGDGTQKNLLHNLSGKDKRIIFYGKVKNSDILKFYEFADLSVFPYRGVSAFGRVIVESLAAGVPPIVTKMPDTNEKIIDGYNGFLFEQENVDQLKDILNDLINNPEKLKSMEKNCMTFAEKYDIEKNIGKWEEIYKEAIKLKQRI